MGRIRQVALTQVFPRTYQITFPRLSENGSYQFTLLPALRDVDGVQMDQNANGIPGEAGDGLSFTLFLDGVPPRVTRHSPAAAAAAPIDHADIWFSESMDTSTLNPLSVTVLYDLPREHPVIGQTAPDPMAAVRALMEGSSAQWQVSGAYAVNLLGLSEQVPGRIVVLTNGSPRRVKLDKLTLVFRRAAPRYLLGAGRPAGMVIQAIRHLRERGIEPAKLEGLRAKLDANTKSELAALTRKLPAWMQPIIQRLTGKVKA